MIQFDELCYHCMAHSGSNTTICPICGKKKDEVKRQDERALLIKTILRGRYVIGRTLGGGGFGIVYIAMDLQNEKRVAIKEFMPVEIARRNARDGRTVIPYKKEEYDYALKHFKLEVDIMRKLQHVDGVIQVMDEFEENGTSYYVMEYLEGDDLLNYINMHALMSYDDAVLLLLPVIKTIYNVHQNGVTHRDLSPDNLFICKGEPQKLKLLDFGSARDNDVSGSSYVLQMKDQYSSPEQVYGKRRDTEQEQDKRADEYSFGAILYSSLTKHRPERTADRVVEDKQKNPCELNPKCTREQGNVILKAMALKKEDRYPDMMVFAYALIQKMQDAKKRKEAESMLNGHSPNIRYDDKQQDDYSRFSSGSNSIRAPYWRNALAILIDGLLAWILIVFFVYVVDGVLTADELGIAVMAGMVGIYAFYACMEKGANCATFGEKVMGIVVVQPDGKELSLGRLMWRQFVRMSFGVPWDWVAIQISGRSISEKAGNVLVYMKGYTPRISRKYMLCFKDGPFANKEFPLTVGSYTIGRDRNSCSIVFPYDYPGISRRHCTLTVCENGSVFICDNGSTYHTYMEGKQTPLNAQVSYPLEKGCVFVLGGKIRAVVY